MKRQLVSTLALFAIVTAGTACGAIADDVAATVNGTDITSARVDDFASSDYVAQLAQQSGTGLVSSPKGTTGGARQRIALSLFVQAQVYEDTIADLDGKVEADDSSSAEKQIADFESSNGSQFPAPVRNFLKRLVAAQGALVRLVGADSSAAAVTPEKIAAYFEAHRDEFGVLTCVDGFAVQQPNAAAAQAAIDDGTPIDAILSNQTLQAQSLSQDGSETCVPVGNVTEPTLAKLVDEGTVGAWASATIEDPANGTLVVFIRPNSREEATATTPSVVTRITQQLTQEAQTAAQSAVGTRIQKAMEAAEVDIDPRYGSWDPKDANLVLAPTAPVVRTPAVTAATLPGQ